MLVINSTIKILAYIVALVGVMLFLIITIYWWLSYKEKDVDEDDHNPHSDIKY